MSALDEPIAEAFDHSLRWQVPSRKRTGVKHLVELGTYNGNGCCSCEDFTMNKEKYLRKGVTPEQAVERGIVKLKAGQKIRDALRCDHIITARNQLVDGLIEKLQAVEAAQAAAAKNRDCPY